MTLKVRISTFCCLSINDSVVKFNQWPYRTSDVRLVKDILEIDLTDVPIFWEQLLAQTPSLEKELRPSFIEALRAVPLEKVGVAFEKAMAMLSK